MIVTLASFDEIFADATRRATMSANLASDTAHLYVNNMSNANHNHLAAMDYLQRTLLRSALDFQNASFQLSRTVLDAAAVLNHAVFEWAAAAIWPWSPLGPLTEPRPVAAIPEVRVPEGDYDATQVGDYVMSALRFQGPMGILASEMGETEQ